MEINEQEIDLGLIRAAQQDQQGSRSKLVQLAEQAVFPYIYRLTFDYHLAQDLCQETLMELIRFLPSLQFNSIKSFWGWIYRTALSKVQKHFRKGDHKHIHLDTADAMDRLSPQLREQQATQLNLLIREELLCAALKAMNAMHLPYRNVLILRCLQGLSYAEIAPILGRSPLGTRLLFFKAKKTLRRRLVQDGFEPSYLLPALAFIAGITMPKPVQATTALVAKNSLEIGPAITLLGHLLSQIGLVLTATVITVCATVGTIAHRTSSSSISSMTTLPNETLIDRVSQGTFACPARVKGIGGPVDNRLELVDFNHPARSSGKKVPIEQMASILHVNKPSGLRLRRRFDWIEVGFGGSVLVDGPGADIFVSTCGCKGFQFCLTNDAGQSHSLAHERCPGEIWHNEKKTILFDLKDQPSGFNATGLRIQMGPNVKNPRGLELQSICARVK
jgi:RNA polymerase sigma-70 factor (ECF subfamily)